MEGPEGEAQEVTHRSQLRLVEQRVKCTRGRSQTGAPSAVHKYDVEH